ncbi:MAG: sulfatase family protein [Planctomycetota bacterium]|jgi:arylsulfatase A-like enzyme
MNNILFIMADQLRADAFGFVGEFPVKTPNIDELAKRGTVFNNAYTPNPVCVPARASIMTGCYSYEHGSYYNDQPWPEDMKTWAEVLRDNCYYTTLIGKTHFHPRKRSAGFQKMFTPLEYKEYMQIKTGKVEKKRKAKISNADDLHRAFPQEPTDLPYDEYKPVVYGTKAVEELELISKRRECGPGQQEPFVMKLSFSQPHSPCNPPEPYFSMYRDKIKEPNATEEELATFSKHNMKLYEIWNQLDKDKLLRARDQYFSSVTVVDEVIGRVIQKLKDMGIYDNTLIILTTDHGEHILDHHMEQKGTFFECSARVPLIFSGPGIPHGKVINENVSLIDIYPTILDYCSLYLTRWRDPVGKLIYEYAGQKETDCMSLMPYFASEDDEPVNPDRIIIAEQAMQGQRFMLKKGNIKINYYLNKDGENEFDYFDLAEDPLEQNNKGKDFKIEDLEPDMKKAFDKVIKESGKYNDGYYYFQDKIRPMYT